MRRCSRTVAFLVALLAGHALAGTAVLTWTAPTKNTDGTTLTNLASFRVYQRCQTSAATQIGNPGAAARTFTTPTIPDDGRQCWFAVSAVDALGAESVRSSEVTKTFTAPPPPAPGPTTYAITWTTAPIVGNRYVRLTATSETAGNPWTSAAEINLLDASGVNLSRAGWVVTADSFESSTSNTAAKAVDGVTTTMWHTKYTGGTTPLPHTFTIDMGTAQAVRGLKYLPRQDGNPNGTIKAYSIDVSTNGTTWTPVASGTFAAGSAEKTVNW